MPSILTEVVRDHESAPRHIIEPDDAWRFNAQLTEGEIGRIVLVYCREDDNMTKVDVFEVPPDVHWFEDTDPPVTYDDVRALGASQSFEVGPAGSGMMPGMDVGIDVNGEQICRMRIRHLPGASPN